MNKQNPKELSYFYHPSNITEWMNEEPNEEEIKFDEGNKRSIPYAIMKTKLDKLCPESWDIKNFHFTQFFTNDRKQWITGHIDLVVSYAYELPDGTGVRKVTRTLAGAATFCIEEYLPNTHFAATVKSLAICNAAQPLGKQFGWNLNPNEDEEQEKDVYSTGIPKQKVNSRNGKESVLMKPDADIRIKYAKADASNDEVEIKRLESIYNFQIG